MKPGKTGIARIIAAGGYSWQGLTAAFQHEAAFRQELFLSIILLPLAIWLGETGLESALMIAMPFAWRLLPPHLRGVDGPYDRHHNFLHILRKPLYP